MDFEKEAKVFKALSDSLRLKIIYLLHDGELCACELLKKLNLSQSGLSYQMKILCDSGIVKARQSGKWIHYSINIEGCQNAIFLLQKITKTKFILQAI